MYCVAQDNAMRILRYEWIHLCEVVAGDPDRFDALVASRPGLKGIAHCGSGMTGVYEVLVRRGHVKAALTGLVRLARDCGYTYLFIDKSWLYEQGHGGLLGREFDPVRGWERIVKFHISQAFSRLGEAETRLFVYLCSTAGVDHNKLNEQIDSSPYVAVVNYVGFDRHGVSYLSVSRNHFQAGLKGMIRLSRKYGYTLVFDHGRRFDPKKGWIHKLEWETNPYAGFHLNQ